MSENNETQQCTQEEEVKEASTTSSVNDIPEIETGYVVGIQPDGMIYFQVLGEKQGLIELLGLHQIAEHRLNGAIDANQGYGYPVVARQIAQLAEYNRQVGETLKVVLNTMSKSSENRIITP